MSHALKMQLRLSAATTSDEHHDIHKLDIVCTGSRVCRLRAIWALP